MPVPARYARFARLLALRDRLAELFARPRHRPARLAAEALEDRLVPDGRPLPLPTIFVGTGDGPPPLVRGFDVLSGQMTFERLLADPGFAGGVRVAAADFTGDGYPDVVTALGPNAGPRVRVLDGKTGREVPGPFGDFMAYDPAFRGGVEVAAADVDGDAVPDVVTAAGAGGGPHVKVFSGRTGAEVRSLFALEPAFRGGVSVAAADFTGDGRADLAVGAGAGGGPRVRVLDLATGGEVAGPLGSFFATDPGFRGGVVVGADWKGGDMDADGRPDLVVGTGPGAAARVTVYSGRTGAVLGDFAPFPGDPGVGVRVGLAYADDDRFADVMVGTGPGVPAQVRVFAGATGVPAAVPTAAFFPFGPDSIGGVSLAATNDPVVPDMSFPAADPVAPASGLPAAFTVTLTATTPDLPTGTVTFTAVRTGHPTVTLGQATLVPGATAGTATASATSAALPLLPGTYAVVAAYGGDAVYAAASTTADVTVEPGPTPWVGVDPDPVVRGREVTFWAGANGDDWPDYPTVEWDFEYDGAAFSADATDDGNWGATHAYDSPGPRTVAARVTDAAGTVWTVTRELTVEPAPPEVTAPDDMTAAQGTLVQLAVTAAADAGVVGVEWWVSGDGEEYFHEPALTGLAGEYTFAEAGEYDLWVVVTDALGQTGEGWFHVSVGNAAPGVGVTVAGPVDEGSAATFTITGLDPAALDTATLYANWTGADEGGFVQLVEDGWWLDPDGYVVVEPDGWTRNPDGTVTVTHVYDRSPGPGGGPYPAVIRVEDEWGAATDYTVEVTVRDVKPQATVVGGGYQVSTPETGGVSVWLSGPGEPVRFTDPVVSSLYDRSAVTYHWKVDGGEPTVTTSPVLVLDPGEVAHTYQVEAWLTDRGGTESVHETFFVGVSSAKPGEPYYAGTSPVYAKVYFEDGGPPAPPRFSYRPEQRKDDWAANTDLVIRAEPDPATAAFATAHGYTVRYHWQYDIVGVYNHWYTGVEYEEYLGGQPVEQTNTTGVLTVPGQPDNRRVKVQLAVDLIGPDGQVVMYSGGFGELVATTPKPPGVIQQVANGLQGLYAVVQRFGDKAGQLWDAITAPGGLERVFTTLKNALSEAIDQFAQNLPTTAQAKFFDFLLGPTRTALAGFANVNILTADSATLTSLLLSYAGLTWDHVYDVVRQQLGAGNLAALEQVAGWFVDPATGQPYDPTDPAALSEFVTRLSGPAAQGGLDLGNLRQEIEGRIQAVVLDGLTKAGVQLAAKFVPGAGAISSLVGGLTWLLDNQHQMLALFDTVVNGIDRLAAGDTAGLKARLVTAFENAIPVMIGFAASQLGLGDLPGRVRRAVDVVPLRVDTALKAAVARIATAATGPTRGGTQGGVHDGRMATEVRFTYGAGNQQYVLWVAQDAAGVKLKLGRANGPLVAELAVKDFIGNRAKAAFADALALAGQLKQRVRPGAQQPNNAAAMPALVALQQQVSAALGRVRDAIQAHACAALGTGCFAAGTKLLTRAGWLPVEDIRPGDEVLARSEFDPVGEAEWKVVEERFERTDCVLHLHVGDEVIRTTPEHPFFVAGKGWTAAGGLRPGDRLCTLEGEWVAVEEAFDTGVFEPVYNLRVADHHTYFVGDEGWGFAVWAHNTYDFISALRVLELVEGQLAVSPTTQEVILQEIRHVGSYGAVGNVTNLGTLVAYELTPDPSGSAVPDPRGTIRGYMAGSAVRRDHGTREGEIKRRSDWVGYIQTQLSDQDARGVTKLGALTEIGQPGFPRATRAGLHGHHIAVKGSGNSSPAADPIAREARDYLLYHGINPYLGRENLVYAPNRGHHTTYIETVRNRLRTVFTNDRGDRDGIVEVLRLAADGYFRANYPGVSP